MIALSWFALRAYVLRSLARWLRWVSATRRRVTLALAVVMSSALTIVALAAPAGAQTVTLQATGHGMFYTEIVLNGELRAQVLVDTGATYLSLCGTMAAKLSLLLGETVIMSTANGRVPNRRTTVHSVRIGALEVRDVAAVVDLRPVCEKGVGEVLVGMSVLRQLQVEVNGATLTLRSRLAPKDPGKDSPGERASLVLLWQLIGALSVVFASLLAWWRWRWAP